MSTCILNENSLDSAVLILIPVFSLPHSLVVCLRFDVWFEALSAIPTTVTKFYSLFS